MMLYRKTNNNYPTGIFCIDIGGTAIKSAIYESTGECLAAFPNRVTPDNSDGALINKMLEMVKSVVDKQPIDGVAIATAGVIDSYSGEVIHASPTIAKYQGTNFKSLIESYFNLPCSIENDANAVALAESWLGAATNCHSALVITLGTGLGGALLIEGRLWHGHGFMAGELGYLPVKDLRLEELASTRAMLLDYHKRSGKSLDGKSFFAQLPNDPLAKTTLTNMLDGLCEGILPCIYLFAPEKIILGGAIAAQHIIIEPLLKQVLAEKLYDKRFMPALISCARLGNQAGMLGALRHFLNQQQLDK